MWRWFVLVAVGLVNVSPAIAAKPPKQELSADPTSVQATARELAGTLKDAAKVDARLDKRIEEFGRFFAVQGPTALDTVQAMLKDSAPEVRAYGAQLLVWCGRGDLYKDYEVSRPARRVIVKTEELGPVAAELMKSSDPFLAAMGEWALAARLGHQYESAFSPDRASAKPWPGAEAPGWYQQWLKRTGESAVEGDYVRQAVAVNAHCSIKALAESAADLLRRAETMMEHVKAHGTPAQIAAAEQAMTKVRTGHAELSKSIKNHPADAATLHKLWLTQRLALRDVCLANPDLNFSQIVFGLRRGDGGGGNITFGRANSSPPGGDLVLKSGFAPSDPVKPLINGRLGPGHLKGLELWFDADRMVFAYAKQPASADDWEQAHLFEMNLDGSALRQLTFGKHHTDQEPTYLPNGDILFVSDRSGYGSQCAGALQQDNMILNLYRCDKDGKNLRAISNNKDFDRHPHLMDDGQVLFLHWEYLDRHLWQTHTLWTCRPDGTMNDALFKQHITTGPMSIREARQIPGTQKLVGIACGHHNSDIGAVFVVNYAQGINQSDAMRNLTPGVSSTEGGYGNVKPVTEGAVKDDGGYYRFPFPLSEKSFLVSYSYNTGGPNYALYYIDVWGNKELIHRDPQTSIAFISPVKNRPRPPALRDRADDKGESEEAPKYTAAGQRFAKVYVHNVYDDLPGVKPGTVKYLRIGQPMPWPSVTDEMKPHGFNDLHYMCTTGWAPAFGMWGWGASRAIGIVPVEADGSAYFKAPADQPVFFQILDKDYVEVRRMRSYVTFMNGENRACVGCHESRPSAPQSISQGLALKREISMPVPPPIFGNRQLPDFETHIQPIFDARCVSCHSEKDPQGGLELTGRKIHHYNQSYRALFGLKPGDPTPSMASGYWNFWYPGEPAPCDDATSKSILKAMHLNKHPGQLVHIASRDLGAEITPPGAFGSSVSRLTKAVLEHRQKGMVKDLTQDEWIALVTWIDLNAQYWGTYVDKSDYFAKKSKTCRRVKVTFPDPWQAPAAGQWYWAGENEVQVRAGEESSPRRHGGTEK